jgi:hypothetical protein
MKILRALVSFAIAIAILLVGCLPPEVLDAIRGTNQAIVVSEPFAEAGYKVLLARCVADAKTEAEGLACIDKTERQWSSYVDSLDAVRKVRCRLEPEKCPSPAAPSDSTTVTVTERP